MKDQKELASRNIKKLSKDPKCWEYNMSGHARSAVEKYLNLAKLSELSLKKRFQLLVLMTTKSVTKTLKSRVILTTLLPKSCLLVFISPGITDQTFYGA
jgi:hypothetical protein